MNEFYRVSIPKTLELMHLQYFQNCNVNIRLSLTKQISEKENQYKNYKFIWIDNTPVKISGRENQVLEQVLNGLSAKQIASCLKLSIRTVEAHIANIKKKACCRTTIQLIAKMK